MSDTRFHFARNRSNSDSGKQPIFSSAIIHSLPSLLAPGSSAGDFASSKLALLQHYMYVCSRFTDSLQFGMTFHGQNLLRTSLGSLMVLSFFLAAIFIPRYELRCTVRSACYVAFFILVFGVCFSHPTPFGLPGFFDNQVLHYTPIHPRLTAPADCQPSQAFYPSLLYPLVYFVPTSAESESARPSFCLPLSRCL